jgi:DNA-binding response OmpR family regulator
MTKHILIIEDDASLVKLYGDMLSDLDVVIQSATTGKDGLSLVQTSKPDLILLDIMLPGGMNGFDVLEQLKNQSDTAQIPVIILTNLESEEKAGKAIGAKDYLIKVNTTTDELVRAVKNALL